MARYRVDNLDAAIVRKRTIMAFRQLRKQGLVTRANFACCQGCACSELGEYLEDRPNKIGAVYWHYQDEESLRRTGKLYLGYIAKDEADLVFIGRVIVQVLQNYGLHTEWNGSIDRRIEVSILK